MNKSKGSSLQYLCDIVEEYDRMAFQMALQHLVPNEDEDGYTIKFRCYSLPESPFVDPSDTFPLDKTCNT